METEGNQISNQGDKFEGAQKRAKESASGEVVEFPIYPRLDGANHENMFFFFSEKLENKTNKKNNQIDRWSLQLFLHEIF